MAKISYTVNWDEVGGFINHEGEVLVKAVKSESGTSANGSRKEIITLFSKEGSSTLHLSMSMKAMWKVKQLLVAMQVPLKSNFNMPDAIAQGKPFWATFEAIQKEDKTYYNAVSFRAASAAEIATFGSGEDEDEAPFDTDDEEDFNVDGASDEEVKEYGAKVGLDIEGLKPKAIRVKLKSHLGQE